MVIQKVYTVGAQTPNIPIKNIFEHFNVLIWVGRRGLTDKSVDLSTRRQGWRVRIPSPTFPFEECIIRGEEDEEEEEEEDEEDLERVKEDRGKWRRHSNQE